MSEIVMAFVPLDTGQIGFFLDCGTNMDSKLMPSHCGSCSLLYIV